jgi:DNA-directed RNA polymerase specialized sigma24 family protein
MQHDGADERPPDRREGAEPDDSELLDRLRDGDGDALRTLMRRYDRLVRFAVFRLCRTECLRDPAYLDARASETWTGLVRSVQRGPSSPPGNLKTYLIQIAKNKCVDAQRRPDGTPSTEAATDEEGLGGVAAEVPLGVELLIRAEEVLALRDCIEQLTHADKKICAHMEDIVSGRWTLAGEALHMPESTLRSRWSAIISKLKTCLQKKTRKTFAPPAAPSDS